MSVADDGLGVERPEALGVLPLRYHILFDAVVRATEDDPRVRALWLGGSIARGPYPG